MNIEMAKPIGERSASLQLSHGAASQTLTAHVPFDVTPAEFGAVTNGALELVRKLTGCNCLSGRISFVVQDNFANVIRVNLNELPAHGL